MLVTLLLIWATGLQAASLHTIIVADTTSHTGDAATAELTRVRDEIGQIIRYTGLVPQRSVILGPEATRDAVLAALDQLRPAADDALIFFFIGHGYRTSHKQGPWPFLYFSSESRSLDLQTVLDVVITKRPRFALILADCCNNIIDGPVIINPQPMLFQSLAPLESYKRLFLDSEGIVVVAASKSGDFAYCHESGHFYSEAFWSAMHREVRSYNPSWSSLLDRASNSVRALQVPYYEILTYP